MTDDFSYHDYVGDEGFLADYNSYQARYAERIRESDKVIVELLRDAASQADNRLQVLDIGCSTGNLLLHLKRLLPKADYVGGELAESSLEECRRNPALEGVAFERLDITQLPQERYDVVIANAVLYMFDESQYDHALRSLAGALKPGGRVILYDFAHPFEHQNLTILETSLMHPKGLRLCFRPMKYVAEHMLAAGFRTPEFRPFELPIELPKPGYNEEVVTYTVDASGGSRLMFRGALFQPWCHMIAFKA